jgi:hypothetical protein
MRENLRLDRTWYFVIRTSKYSPLLSIFAQNITAMPEISRFFGIIIRMYFGDHNPPHFHAIYQEYTAEYDIQTLEVIRGSLLSRAHSMVLE